VAQTQGCRLLVTDPDPERLQVAATTARERGLQDKVEFQQVDLDDVRSNDNLRQLVANKEHFDAAVVEATLTKYPRDEKVEILKQLYGCTDQLLLHEICIRGCKVDESKCCDAVIKNVGSSLHEPGYHPLTTHGWIHVLEESGFAITDIETGPVRLVQPLTILQDEGPWGAAQIGWNLATQPELRERFERTRQVLQDYENITGYIIVRAVKK